MFCKDMLDWGFSKKSFTFVCTVDGLAIFVDVIVVFAVVVGIAFAVNVRIVGFGLVAATTCFDPEPDIDITYGFAIIRFPFAGITLANKSQSE